MNRRDFINCTGKACGSIGLGWLLGSTLLQSCGTGLSVMKMTAQDGNVAIPLSQVSNTAYTLLRVKNFPFDIGLQKNQEGAYQALVLMCPHANQPLTKTGSGYICTMHGSKFGKDGSLLKGPSSRPMPTLPVSQEADQIIINTKAFSY